jgi:hypothetical protein
MGSRRAEFRLHKVVGHALSDLHGRMISSRRYVALRLTDEALLTDPRSIAEPKPAGERVQLPRRPAAGTWAGRTPCDGALRLVPCAACVYDRKDGRAWHPAEGWRSEGVGMAIQRPRPLSEHGLAAARYRLRVSRDERRALRQQIAALRQQVADSRRRRETRLGPTRRIRWSDAFARSGTLTAALASRRV